MDTREIMIGNIVNRSGFLYEVGLYDVNDYCYYKPVSIDEEFLSDSGFKKETNEVIGTEYRLDTKKYHIKVQRFSNTANREWSVHIDNDVYMSVGGGDVQYVHQLQNLVKVLTGEDLFIKVNAK